MKPTAPIIMIAGLILSLAVQTYSATNSLDWAPLFSRGVDINGDWRWRMLGPLLEGRQASDARSFRAVHPLASTVRNPSDQRQESDLIWPLFISKSHRNFWQWRLAGLGLWRDYDVEDPNSRYALRILPVYYQGRGQDHKPYLAVFPIAGKISDILVWDEVQFILFPVYGYARINAIETHAYLWPLLFRSQAPHDQRLSLLPFYGYSRRDNGFDKRFLCWPFWTSARYFYPHASGYGWILFPLIGHVKLSNQESWMFLPPLTRFSKSQHSTQINCPWPLFQYSSGNIEKLYFWPIAGYKIIGHIHTSFLLWPIGISSCRETQQGIERQRFIVPIVYSETLTERPAASNAAAPVVSKRVFKLWPLFSYHREKDCKRLHLLSLCPLKDFVPIERNYASLWTIYSHAACGPIREDELLWGWLRYRRQPDKLLKASLFPLLEFSREGAAGELEWLFLKGLLGSESIDGRKRFRMFYLLRW